MTSGVCVMGLASDSYPSNQKPYLAVGAYLSPKAYLAGHAYLSQSGCVWVGGPDLIYLKSLFLSISKWGMGGVTPVLLFRAG